MSRANKKGRSTAGHFVQLPYGLLHSAAWRSLSPGERSVYLAIRQTYNGHNNGCIGLGARRAAELANVSKNTACKHFAVLIERGFTECATPGGFNTNSRRQTEWRLTDERCHVTGAIPTRAYLKWRPEEKSTSQSRDTEVPNRGQFGADQGATVPQLGLKSQARAA